MEKISKMKVGRSETVISTLLSNEEYCGVSVEVMTLCNVSEGEAKAELILYREGNEHHLLRSVSVATGETLVMSHSDWPLFVLSPGDSVRMSSDSDLAFDYTISYILHECEAEASSSSSEVDLSSSSSEVDLSSSNSSLTPQACENDDCSPRPTIRAEKYESFSNGDVSFKITFDNNENCYRNIRYSIDGGAWVDFQEYEYNKNVENFYLFSAVDGQIFWDGLHTGQSVFWVNVGTVGIANSYGCYNMAGNAPEMTEETILGYAVLDYGSNESLADTHSRVRVIKTLVDQISNPYLNPYMEMTDSSGLRIASIGNPLDYSCFVTVGDANNVAYSEENVQGYFGGTADISIGSVNREYQIQKYELTQGEFLEFLNACFRSDPNDLFLMLECHNWLSGTGFGPVDIVRSGSEGNYEYSLDEKFHRLPMAVPILLALRMCNWLHNKVDDPDTTYTDDGAYDLRGLPTYEPPTILEDGGVQCPQQSIFGYSIDPETNTRVPTIVRRAEARYFIPNNDEWFKAAYYKGGGVNSDYWVYANSTDAIDQDSFCNYEYEIYGFGKGISCADKDLNGLRFNCSAEPGLIGRVNCENCSGLEVIKQIFVENATEICFKGFATTDCETNQVCLTLQDPPPELPEPEPLPCLADISGYSATIAYDPLEGPCAGGHTCDYAMFKLYINEIFITDVNLNNLNPDPSLEDPEDPSAVYRRRVDFQIPPNIPPVDGRYSFELRCDTTIIPYCHMGISWLRLWDLDDNLVLDQCFPNDRIVFTLSCDSSSSSESDDYEGEGFRTIVAYSDTEGPCPGGHRCNRADYDLFVNGTRIKRVNLNNGYEVNDLPVFPGERSVELRIPPELGSESNEYVVELKCRQQECHEDISAWVRIWDAGNNVVFDDCVAVDQTFSATIDSDSSTAESSSSSEESFEPQEVRYFMIPNLRFDNFRVREIIPSHPSYEHWYFRLTLYFIGEIGTKINVLINNSADKFSSYEVNEYKTLQEDLHKIQMIYDDRAFFEIPYEPVENSNSWLPLSNNSMSAFLEREITKLSPPMKIYSSSEIDCYLFFKLGAGGCVCRIMPESLLGTVYYAIPNSNNNISVPALHVITTQPNTQLEIFDVTNNQIIFNGEIEQELNFEQHLLSNIDLNSTIRISSNKKVAVFESADCISHKKGSYCNSSMNQLLPSDTFGRLFFIPRTVHSMKSGRATEYGDDISIFSLESDTTITINSWKTINLGVEEVYNLDNFEGGVIVSNNPICVKRSKTFNRDVKRTSILPGDPVWGDPSTQYITPEHLLSNVHSIGIPTLVRGHSFFGGNVNNQLIPHPAPDHFATFVLKTQDIDQLSINGHCLTTSEKANFEALGGLERPIENVAMQNDNKILVSGNFAGGLTRFNSNGLQDVGLEVGSGFEGTSPIPSVIKVQSDGKIILGGSFTSYNGTNAGRIIRLNADGSIDTSFNTGTGFSSSVLTIAIQSDDKIIAGGLFTSYNGTNVERIIRLNTDGSVDTDFNATGFDNSVLSIAIQSDDKILVGGAFLKGIARLNSDGTKDVEFNVGTGFNYNSAVLALLPDSNNKILAVGNFINYNGTSSYRIARLNINGSIDGSFSTGSGFNNMPLDLAIQSDNKIIVVGIFTSYNGISTNKIARLNANGTFDETFVTGSGFEKVVNDGISIAIAVNSVKIQNDGKIIAGGEFTKYNGIKVKRIARLNEDGTLDQTFSSGSDNEYSYGFVQLPINDYKSMEPVRFDFAAPNKFYVCVDAWGLADSYLLDAKPDPNGTVYPYASPCTPSEENSSSSSDSGSEGGGIDFGYANDSSSPEITGLFDESSFETPEFNMPQKVLTGLYDGSARWGNVCSYKRPVWNWLADNLSDWGGLRLASYSEENDTENNWVASVSIQSGDFVYGTAEGEQIINSISFHLEVNTRYLDQYDQEAWNDIITHEMGHALGIGIFWNSSEFYLDGSSYPNTQEAYNQITSLERQKTPLEDTGSLSTASAHWEDDYRSDNGTNYYGFANEIMIGTVNPSGMIISNLSVGILSDFGYDTQPSNEGSPTLVTSLLSARAINASFPRCGCGTRCKTKISPGP